MIEIRQPPYAKLERLDTTLTHQTSEKVKYYINTIAWSDNWAIWGSIWSAWKEGFILSSNGTCANSWSSNEIITMRVLDSPFQGITKSIECKANIWDSDCFAWDGSDNSLQQCSMWVLNKYKVNKTDSNEIVLFVSNLNQDIERSYELQTGDLDAPFTDLMTAYDNAFKKMMPYLLDANGNPIVVRIALFKGDHFVIKQVNQLNWIKQSWYKNFKIVIR